MAGVEIDLGDVEYWLAGCRECGFQWKSPAIDERRLLECYAASDSGHWELEPDSRQRRFDVFCDTLQRHAHGRRVLDVGCSNGAFLRFLGHEWQRFGIEPSTSAAQIARERGIEILGAELSDLNESDVFDAIVAFDVVEHVSEPMPFFHQAFQRLSSGGVLVILTGDTSSLAWRLQGSAYWYCSMPEHVSFYCRSALGTVGDRLGMQELEYRQLCHKRLPLRRWASDMLKSAAYVGGRSVGGLGVPTIRRWVVDRRGPSIMSAKDHLLYVFRRP